MYAWDLHGDTERLSELGIKRVAYNASSELIVTDIQNAVGVARAQSCDASAWSIDANGKQSRLTFGAQQPVRAGQ